MGASALPVVGHIGPDFGEEPLSAPHALAALAALALFIEQGDGAIVCVHSRGSVNGCQRTAGSGGSQGFPASASRMASSVVMPWAAAESR